MALVKINDIVIFNPPDSSSLATYKGELATVTNIDGNRILIELHEHNVMIHTDAKCLIKK